MKEALITMKYSVINLTKNVSDWYTEELKHIVERNRRNGKIDYVYGSENSILLKYQSPPTNWSIDSVQSQSKLQ